MEVEHGESPLLALTLQHRNRVGVVVQYSASALQVRINVICKRIRKLAGDLKILSSGFHWIVVSRLWLQPPSEPDAGGGRGHDHWPGGGAGGAVDQ